MIEKQEVRKLLMRAEKARRQILQPCFSQIGLTFGQGQARILDTLLSKDHITQKELALACHMDVTTMSRSLDRLEEAGYLERKRTPDCRRSFLICLTPQGEEEANKVREILQFVDERIWLNLEQEDMEIFCKCLEKICQNLENS